MKIKDHFAQKHTWLDLFGMLLLWSMTYLSDTLPFEMISIIKVFAIVSTLEFLSFTFFHFFSNTQNILLQSFIGGFISSTTVFVKLTDKNNPIIKNQIILPSLLLAYIAMLIECILIFYGIIGFNQHNFLMPVFIQLLILIIAFIINRRIVGTEEKIEIDSDHPIIWKKVITLSFFIIFLIFLLKYLSKAFSTFNLLVVFLLSLFEAHGVFTATLSNQEKLFTSTTSLQILLILTGNYLSKTFLVLKNKDIKIRNKIFITFSISLIASWFSFFFLR